MTYSRSMLVPARWRLASLAPSLAITFLAAAGCSPSAGSFHSPAATRSALAGAQLDARAVVLTTDAGDANANAIAAALLRLGTPYDVVNVTTTSLTADMLATGSHGKYQAVFL